MTFDDIDDVESQLLEDCVRNGHLEQLVGEDGKFSYSYTDHGYKMMELLDLGQKYFDEETFEIFQELVITQGSP